MVEADSGAVEVEFRQIQVNQSGLRADSRGLLSCGRMGSCRFREEAVFQVDHRIMQHLGVDGWLEAMNPGIPNPDTAGIDAECRFCLGNGISLNQLAFL